MSMSTEMGNDTVALQGLVGVEADIAVGLRAPTHYETLNIDPTATKMAVREAYLRLKNTFGSGNAALYSLMTEEETRLHALAVDEAYRVLNDETRRAEYDRSLGLDWEKRNARLSDIPGAERIAIADEHFAVAESRHHSLQQHGHDLVDGNGHADPALHGRNSQVISTTRSTLAIVKTIADNARGESMQARLATLIAEGDPGDGDLFRRLREAVGVSEAEMQERTKISLEYLRALESNRFERLPQCVYVKGFLRSYFRYLGIPEAEKFVTAFAARLQSWQQSRKA